MSNYLQDEEIERREFYSGLGKAAARIVEDYALARREFYSRLEKAIEAQSDRLQELQERQPVQLGRTLFEFATFTEWLDKAQSWFGNCEVEPLYRVCLDSKGRICPSGKEMMRARDEDAFPVTVYCLTPREYEPKKKLLHIGLDIRGVLALSEEEFLEHYDGVFTGNDGRFLTQAEVRTELQQMLENGQEVMVCDSQCDNADPKTGCRGHMSNAS